MGPELNILRFTYDKSKNFIVEKIRKLIIKNCDSLEGIDFKLNSLQENQISCVIDSINKFSSLEIPDFNIKSVSMLLPREDSQRNLKEQQILEETKKTFGKFLLTFKCIFLFKNIFEFIKIFHYEFY